MVEVKYRRATTKHDALPLQDAQISKDKGLNSRQNGLDDAVFAVTDHSRRRISRAAGLFISQNPEFASMGLRYDIVAISGFSIRHLKDAWRD